MDLILSEKDHKLRFPKLSVHQYIASDDVKVCLIREWTCNGNTTGIHRSGKQVAEWGVVQDRWWRHQNGNGLTVRIIQCPINRKPQYEESDSFHVNSK